MAKIGQTIFHLTYGIGTIVAIQKMELLGTVREMTSIQLHNGMSVMLPSKDLDACVREPLARAHAEQVLEHLKECPSKLAGDFKVRNRRNQERLASGDPYLIGELIKGLLWRARQRPLANSDREQLQKATELLAREIAHAFNRDHKEVAQELETICQKGFVAA